VIGLKKMENSLQFLFTQLKKFNCFKEKILNHSNFFIKRLWIMQGEIPKIDKIYVHKEMNGNVNSFYWGNVIMGMLLII
jgi:hypothetical protein